MNTRPRLTSTHTVAELAVSARAYDEIATRLRAAGYDHVFEFDGPLIDMTGIGLVIDDGQSPTSHAWRPGRAAPPPTPDYDAQQQFRPAQLYDPQAPLEVDWRFLTPDDPGPEQQHGDERHDRQGGRRVAGFVGLPLEGWLWVLAGTAIAAALALAMFGLRAGWIGDLRRMLGAE